MELRVQFKPRKKYEAMRVESKRTRHKGGTMPFLFTMSQDKLEDLKNLLRSFGSCLIAYSGGVDSAFLAVVAHQVLGEKSLAIIADSPSLARRELDEAVKLAEKFGFALRIIHPHGYSCTAHACSFGLRCDGYGGRTVAG